MNDPKSYSEQVAAERMPWLNHKPMRKKFKRNKSKEHGVHRERDVFSFQKK